MPYVFNGNCKPTSPCSEIVIVISDVAVAFHTALVVPRAGLGDAGLLGLRKSLVLISTELRNVVWMLVRGLIIHICHSSHHLHGTMAQLI